MSRNYCNLQIWQKEGRINSWVLLLLGQNLQSLESAKGRSARLHFFSHSLFFFLEVVEPTVKIKSTRSEPDLPLETSCVDLICEDWPHNLIYDKWLCKSGEDVLYWPSIANVIYCIDLIMHHTDHNCCNEDQPEYFGQTTRCWAVILTSHSLCFNSDRAPRYQCDEFRKSSIIM